jgi:hypothetical protein
MILQFATESEMTFGGALEVPNDTPFINTPVLIANMPMPVVKTKAKVCAVCNLPIRPLALHAKGYGHGVSLRALRATTTRLGVPFIHEAVLSS